MNHAKENVSVCLPPHLANFFTPLTGNPIVVPMKSSLCIDPVSFRLLAVVAHRPPLDTEAALGKTHMFPYLTVTEMPHPNFIEVTLSGTRFARVGIDTGQQRHFYREGMWSNA